LLIQIDSLLDDKKPKLDTEKEEKGNFYKLFTNSLNEMKKSNEYQKGLIN